MDLETILKNTSRTLYLSVQVLPRKIRPAFSVAYLLCRYADTIADTPILPAERRLHWIKLFPTLIKQQSVELIEQLTREIEGGSENPYEKILIGHLPQCLQAYNQIAPQQQAFIIEVAQSVCAGMQTDLTVFPAQPTQIPIAFKTKDELKYYCRLMGGEPGLFWSRLCQLFISPKTYQENFPHWGQHIGDTLQIVNILRDLPKDLHIGRCYFPAEDLQAAGLAPEDLLDPTNSARFEPVKQKWIAWGLKRLRDGILFFNQLPKTHPGLRAAVAWPMLWATDTLYKLNQTPDLLNPQKRVKITRRTIYFTLLLTPFILCSNRLFARWLDKKINKISTENLASKN